MNRTWNQNHQGPQHRGSDSQNRQGPSDQAWRGESRHEYERNPSMASSESRHGPRAQNAGQYGREEGYESDRNAAPYNGQDWGRTQSSVNRSPDTSWQDYQGAGSAEYSSQYSGFGSGIPQGTASSYRPDYNPSQSFSPNYGQSQGHGSQYQQGYGQSNYGNTFGQAVPSQSAGQAYGSQGYGSHAGSGERSYSNAGSNHDSQFGRSDAWRGSSTGGRPFDSGWDQRASRMSGGSNPFQGARPSYGEGSSYRSESGYYSNSGSLGGNRGQFHGKGPQGYKKSDQRLEEQVCEALSEHGDIDASNIRVSVQNGEVTLSGQVEDLHTKRLAEDIVEHVSGISEVTNQIRIKRELSGESQSHQSLASSSYQNGSAANNGSMANRSASEDSASGPASSSAAKKSGSSAGQAPRLS